MAEEFESFEIAALKSSAAREIGKQVEHFLLRERVEQPFGHE